MLSVLIPCKNTSVNELVQSLFQQAKRIQLQIEVIVLEDGSDLFLNKNQYAISNQEFHWIFVPENKGRMATRCHLATLAKYETLLFIDADATIPPSFLENYRNENIHYTVICGGIAYLPTYNTLLRYRYGIKRESVDAEIRNQKPYHYVFSSNLLISKSIWNRLQLPKTADYGTDLLLCNALFQLQIPVKHINNPIHHLGIEEDTMYLEKLKNSVVNRKKWYHENKEIRLVNNMLMLYHLMLQTKIIYVIRYLFLITQKWIIAKIKNPKSSLIWVDLYRIGILSQRN